mmetsp:Transcript_11878/g.22244  ORF Transcript_11878/g.22244 Transcript_11878/m.22244 type:complete len:894 (-) Transcript_11878:838-3519(-)
MNRSSSSGFQNQHIRSNTDHNNNDIEQIILELSRKEAIQNEKRERCSQLFDSIQSYQNKINTLREQIRDTQNELQVLDDEIDELQKSKEKIMSCCGESSFSSSLVGRGGGNKAHNYDNKGSVTVGDAFNIRNNNDNVKSENKEVKGTLDGHFTHGHSRTREEEKVHDEVLEDKRASLNLLQSVHDVGTNTSSAPYSSSGSGSGSIFPPRLQSHFHHDTTANAVYGNHGNSNSRVLGGETSNRYPWSNQINHELRNTFRIQSFRDHQREIINSTMSGQDVFVIMRTGGGKSLTYQLPALLEGKGPQKKVTVVISPLLSLIRDQEEQMNQFSKGTATSFSSASSSAEQTRRWNLVRDPSGGICLIFVTPEKVYKSGRFKSEMEKLNQQNRLGRFVIDECHCCSVWGFDFRTDYTKLGILKQHFPRIPLIAVTATASDRVREDCCNILRIGRNYRFYRSSANRPNLKYCIKVKPEKADDVVEEMAKFIRGHHPRNAGIIYCFSKKEANSVAEKLSSMGISAKPYHSDVSDTAKERIHRSWMSNKTQVVVATIAFGLGINKPDVRFVLHHSLSKTLEAYYQESGRAGRDGGEADCVLYYSPKDVCRTLGMIHGERTEIAFWSMARYAQMHGDDALCKRIILSNLGEPGSEKIEDVINCGGANSTTEEREIGMFCKDLVKMIHNSGRDMTMTQIVQMWRSKGRDTPDYIKDSSLSSELTKDECERVIVSLMISNILYPNVKFTAYNNIVYIGLKPQAMNLIQSQSPKVRIRFPIRSKDSASKAANKNGSKSETNTSDNSIWISTKKSKNPRKRPAEGMNTKTVSKKKPQKKRKTDMNEELHTVEVIDILDNSSDDGNSYINMPTINAHERKVNHRSSLKKGIALSDNLESSESEYEFE